MSKKESQMISEHNQIILSPEDSKAFVNSLLDSPEPTTKMILNAQAYKRSISLQ